MKNYEKDVEEFVFFLFSHRAIFTVHTFFCASLACFCHFEEGRHLIRILVFLFFIFFSFFHANSHFFLRVKNCEFSYSG